MKNSSPSTIGFLQALGLVGYISLIGTFMYNGEKLVGEPDNLFGPIFFLTLFSFSVLICAFIALGYPIKLFWIKKEPKKAIQVVGFMTLFLFVFLATIFGVLLAK
jgi:hypothetical protein